MCSCRPPSCSSRAVPFWPCCLPFAQSPLSEWVAALCASDQYWSGVLLLQLTMFSAPNKMILVLWLFPPPVEILLAKSLLLHLTLCDPVECSPPGSSRLLCPWDSPGKNTGVGCYALLQGIFLTQGSNPGLSSALASGFFTTSTTYGSPVACRPHTCQNIFCE